MTSEQVKGHTPGQLAMARNIAAKHVGWDTYEDAAAHNHHTEDRVEVALAAILETQRCEAELVALLERVLDFYDALPTEHAPGEVELLDSITAAISRTGAA